MLLYCIIQERFFAALRMTGTLVILRALARRILKMHIQEINDMTANDLINTLDSGALKERFNEIYVDPALYEKQKQRYTDAIGRFTENFGSDGDISIFSAPGRSEIAGNHTDHQHGEVLAASINRDAIAIARKNEDNRVRLISDGSELIDIDVTDLSAKKEEEGTTAGIIRGMLYAIWNHGFITGGFDAYVTSQVLIGAGLSSSASFETMIGVTESYLYNDGKISATEIAIMGPFAENVFFGKPCGLMDQMACSVGSLVHIDFKEPAKPVTEQVKYDFASAGYRLCITDTKGSHADLTPDYAAVPAEMKAAAAYFGKEVLREVAEDDFVKAIPAIREKCGDRAVLRGLHFYNENRRVQQDVAALKADDIDTFLKGVQASGDSSFKYLQNVYTNHDVQHQNVSVALAVSEAVLNGRGACRVHGGGFAGTMQAWVPEDLCDEYKKALDAVFGEGSCEILAIRPCGGIKVV